MQSFWGRRGSNTSAGRPFKNGNRNVRQQTPSSSSTSSSGLSVTVSAQSSHPPPPGNDSGYGRSAYRPWKESEEYNHLMEVRLNPNRAAKHGVNYRQEMLQWIAKSCCEIPNVIDLTDTCGTIWLLRFKSFSAKKVAQDMLSTAVQFRLFDFDYFTDSSRAYIAKHRMDLKINRPATNPTVALRLVSNALGGNSARGRPFPRKGPAPQRQEQIQFRENNNVNSNDTNDLQHVLITAEGDAHVKHLEHPAEQLATDTAQATDTGSEESPNSPHDDVLSEVRQPEESLSTHPAVVVVVEETSQSEKVSEECNTDIPVTTDSVQPSSTNASESIQPKEESVTELVSEVESLSIDAEVIPADESKPNNAIEPARDDNGDIDNINEEAVL